VNRGKRGFTLIELLVVIAIIGILATIVLVSVNKARTKAKDTAIKGALEQLRLAAEMYYDENSSSYTNFDSSDEYSNISSSISNNGGTLTCNISGDGTAYCASSPLPGGGSQCVDSTGVMKSGVECGTGTACP